MLAGARSSTWLIELHGPDVGNLRRRDENETLSAIGLGRTGFGWPRPALRDRPTRKKKKKAMKNAVHALRVRTAVGVRCGLAFRR